MEVGMERKGYQRLTSFSLEGLGFVQTLNGEGRLSFEKYLALYIFQLP